MTGGAKGGRKANLESQRPGEEKPPVVQGESPDKQGGEDLWQRHKAERGVWSRRMLETLERGVKGGKWFSLIDSRATSETAGLTFFPTNAGNVYSEKTLAAGWEKVKSNAGACGVDGITIERFGKQAKERLLMERVGEYIADGRVLGMIEGFLKAGVMEMIEPGSHFDFLGLFSLEAAQAMEQTSLREGAN